MGENSKIQWTDHTFNPWVGCTRISPGCQHCYAEAYDRRVGGAKRADGSKALRWGPKAPRVRTTAENWRKPLAWNRAAAEAGLRHRVFCASLADVFERLQAGQEGDLDSWRLELFDLVARTPALDWLLLTKRPGEVKRGLVGASDAFERTPGCTHGLELVEEWLQGRPPANVWLGTTVEDQQRADERIPALLEVPATVRFLSCEPLLEALDFNTCKAWNPDDHALYLEGIDWIIVGGESGPGARPFDVAWARVLLAQARHAKVPVFVKQLGSNPVGMLGGDRRFLRDPAGGDPSEWPPDLRVRHFPVRANVPTRRER